VYNSLGYGIVHSKNVTAYAHKLFGENLLHCVALLHRWSLFMLANIGLDWQVVQRLVIDQPLHQQAQYYKLYNRASPTSEIQRQNAQEARTRIKNNVYGHVCGCNLSLRDHGPP
jgi:hypothetical protein